MLSWLRMLLLKRRLGRAVLVLALEGAESENHLFSEPALQDD